MKVCYFWLTMGHYHFARMNALSKQPEIKLSVIEATDTDDHYWERNTTNQLFDHHIILKNNVLDKETTKAAWNQLEGFLEKVNPDILVNAAGYFYPSSYQILKKWKKKSQKKLVLWSESTEIDQKRNFVKEFAKKQILKIYDGAIVAGFRHKAYLEKLGFETEKIQIVGNVVDNAYFANENLKNSESGFLYVGRLLPIKNVDGLLKAYHIYSKKSDRPLSLKIVGDGPEMNRLKNLRDTLGLCNVEFAGNFQVEEVREAYRVAHFFILPSHSEPWGLVVNEALASGLPVIVSEQAGCASELIQNGVNGFTFDAHNVDKLAENMLQLASLDESGYKKFSLASKEIISRFTVEHYADACSEYFKSV